MAGSKKLTGAQLELLRDVAARPQSVVRAYRPATALVKLGLLIDRSPNNEHAMRLEVSTAGAALLSPTSPGAQEDRSDGKS